MNLPTILYPFSRVSRIIAVALALVACLLIASSMKAGALTQAVWVPSSGDTEIRSANPNTNYGSATTMTVDGDEPTGTDKNTAALIRFSLPTLPAGATITDTRLRLDVTNSTSEAYRVFVMKEAWVEGEATWDMYQTASVWDLAGGRGLTDRESPAIARISPSATGVQYFDLGADFDRQVGDWVSGEKANNGIQLINNGAKDGFGFSTHEVATASQRPQLIINYDEDTTPPETTSPETTITSGAKEGETLTSTNATFAFSSSETGSTFECSLDGAAYSTCTSPKSYTNLSSGSHTFSVRATDEAGNVDLIPAKRTWTIETILPPPTDTSKLAWAPPVLTNPISVDVPANDTRTGNGVTRVSLAPGQDARINLPSATKAGGLWIEGGRNVIVIGGHIQPNPNRSQVSGSLGVRGFYIKNNTGTVHIEGTLINSPDHREYDALEMDSGQTTLQLENNRWLDVAGTSGTNHGDIIQPYGTGVREVRIDRMTASSRYQGLQMYSDFNRAGAYLQNVNLIGKAQTVGTSGGQLVWVADDACGHATPYSFDEVYVTPRPGYNLGESVWPNAYDFRCPASVTNGYLTWPRFAAITGGIKLGPPPGGDFVPAGVAGPGYVTPGYQQ